MIRFDIPAEVDPVVASAAITDEIDKGTKELVARMSDEAVTEVDIKKMAEKIVGKSDVINCFDIVIKAIVKKRPMSNNELLTHEENELIEHGFYRSEQLSLL